jgi:hypothetical protein
MVMPTGYPPADPENTPAGATFRGIRGDFTDGGRGPPAAATRGKAYRRMTKHQERLDCPLCGTALVGYDGLGDVGEDLLRRWRQALAEHRPHCPGPSPVSAPPVPPAGRPAGRAR